MSEKIIANQNAGQKPATEKPGTTDDASIINSALITRENIPSVRMFIGRVNKKIIGFINTFIRARTTAKTSAPIGVTITPGSR